MSERRKLQDIIEVVKKGIEIRDLAITLAMLENLAKEDGVYVKLKGKDVLALCYETLPYEAGYQVAVILRNGIAVVYDIFRDRDGYVDRVQVYIRRV